MALWIYRIFLLGFILIYEGSQESVEDPCGGYGGGEYSCESERYDINLPPENPYCNPNDPFYDPYFYDCY